MLKLTDITSDMLIFKILKFIGNFLAYSSFCFTGLDLRYNFFSSIEDKYIMLVMSIGCFIKSLVYAIEAREKNRSSPAQTKAIYGFAFIGSVCLTAFFFMP